MWDTAHTEAADGLGVSTTSAMPLNQLAIQRHFHPTCIADFGSDLERTTS
jgi:hypothetical protein